ncbi:hypothetical protein CAC42_5435 [Sphaceloma murrayae]|uniref:Uncharacterized protein n=1 Tax=Sphaceloma murrayae TaxID=2082308 RepID=A0A2K1QV08_9PEZI|nr:hypothetical protein CAC42_5435 [Sphaceloma murrayae]
MLPPTTLLLLLAYAALYAFAYAIPKSYVPLDERDALSAPRLDAAAPKLEIRTDATATPSKRRTKRDTKDYTEAAGPLVMVAAGPVMSGGTVTLTTGEGQGFWHSRCAGPKC